MKEREHLHVVKNAPAAAQTASAEREPAVLKKKKLRKTNNEILLYKMRLAPS